MCLHFRMLRKKISGVLKRHHITKHMMKVYVASFTIMVSEYPLSYNGVHMVMYSNHNVPKILHTVVAMGDDVIYLTEPFSLLLHSNV